MIPAKRHPIKKTWHAIAITFNQNWKTRHLDHWHQWWIHLICTVMFQKRHGHGCIHAHFNVTVIWSCPAFLPEHDSRAKMYTPSYAWFISDYRVNLAVMPLWCATCPTQLPPSLNWIKRMRALLSRCHSSWQFPPWDLQVAEECLSKIAAWTSDNMITQMNIGSENLNTFNVRHSNMNTFTIALRHSYLCVPSVPCAAWQMDLWQQAPASYLCFADCRDPISCNPLVARILLAKPG